MYTKFGSNGKPFSSTKILARICGEQKSLNIYTDVGPDSDKVKRCHDP